MTDETRRAVIADALAASAITHFEMSLSADEVRTRLIDMWIHVGAPIGAFRDAVRALPRLPQPVDEDAATTVRRDELMALLGGSTSTQQLNASLLALELLQQMALEEEQPR